MEDYMTEVLNDVTVELDEREKLMLTALRDLYDEKHGMLLVSVKGVAYHLIRRFLKDSVERDWNIASNMQLTILSLALKGVITILDKDAEEQNFVIAKEGLEVKRE